MSSTLRMAMAVIFAALICGWISGARAVEIATVAKTGDVAPGAGGAVFSRFDLIPVLNGAGEVAFLAELTGSDVTFGVNKTGLWAGRPGGLALVAREGDPAPGAASVFDRFGPSSIPVLNGAGQLAFRAGDRGGGVGIWAGRPGTLRLVARTGDPAPGLGGAVFKRFLTPKLNGAGEVALYANLRGSGVTGASLWVGRPGRLVLAVRRGASAPGTPPGVTFGGLHRPLLNGVGELAFRANLRGSDVTSANDEGLFAGVPGGLALAARSGGRAPGAGGAVFDRFEDAVLNGAGEVAFLAELRGSGVNSANKQGLWAGPPGGLALAARSGGRAPGAGGAVFDRFEDAILNGAGEVAFPARLSGSGVTSDNDEALFAGASGALQLIAREDNAIEVAPSDFRTVAYFGESLSGNGLIDTGNEDGRPSGFSDGGQWAFSATFTDGTSGVFLSPPDAPKVHRMPSRAIRSAWEQVILPRSFSKPVIIAGPPGYRNKAPGVVRLRKIQGAKGRFQARFQEWDYLDGKHPEERADFLAMAKGRTVMQDGSIWEAGTVDVRANRNWRSTPFTSPFPGVPEVFVTVQPYRNALPLSARVQNVTPSGFEVSIQEEERAQRLKIRRRPQTVGYLAVYSPSGQGTIAGGVDGTKYRLKEAEVNHRFKKVLGERIKLQEEKSKDKEVKHAKEAVSVMTLGRGFFAQQGSDEERDTTALRRR